MAMNKDDFMGKLGQSLRRDPWDDMRKIRQDVYEQQMREREEIKRRMFYAMDWGKPWLPTQAVAMPVPKPTIDMAKLDALKAAEPRKVMQRVPDRIEVMTGWRAWRVYNNKLKAIGQDNMWPVKQAMKAKCSTNSKHAAPFKACECGVWAFSSLDKLVPALASYSDVPILGKVSLWGRVIECENGFRAQFAYPSELWLFDSSMEELGYIYGVPVRTI